MLIIGHRGAMGYAPENTLLSVKKALQLDVDCIEIDVHAIDHHLLIIHDDTLDRTTNGKGSIYNKTFSQLRQLDAGQGEKIPTLEEVCNLVDKRSCINIELKGKNTALPVSMLIQKYLKQGWHRKQFLLSSFHYDELALFHQLMPECPTGVLTTEASTDCIALAKKLAAQSVNPCLECVNKSFVEQCHQSGLRVLVYTVNDLKDIQKMQKLKVDGIFSNYPDRAKILIQHT